MAGHDADATIVALSEEQLHVRKDVVETGRVRVRTIVDEHDVSVQELLRRDAVSVERVPIEREIEAAPSPRDEDGVLVIPVVEERLVKRLFLTEELRVRRVTTEQAVTTPATLRRMRAVVERDGDDHSNNRGSN